MRVQLFPLPTARPGAKAIEQAVVQGALSFGLEASVVQAVNHDRDTILVMYGSGSPDRSALLNAHLRSGGRVVCLDGGYFGCVPAGTGNYFRFAIDALHVKPEHMEGTPDNDERWSVHSLPLSEDYDPNGPVLVIGMGRKSRQGLGIHTWEITALNAAKHRFRGRQVIYRPKIGKSHRRDPVRWRSMDGTTPIAQLLKGASLVIARHSNVSVDACLQGIPVECEDGGARWLYQSGSVQPLSRRISFLHRLSWWQWRACEMRHAWEFLLPRLMVP